MAQAQSLSDSVTTVTPAEVGVQVVVTDKLLRNLPGAMMRKIGRVMGNAMAVKLDSDLVALLGGFTSSGPGVGQALGAPEIAVGVALLRGATEPAPEPIYCVLHPYQWFDVWADLTRSTAATTQTTAYVASAHVMSDVGNVRGDALTNYFVGRLAGVPIFIDGNIEIVTGDDAYGGVFSREAIILVETETPGLERERDASLRGWELNVVSEYGTAEYVDAWGHEIASDVTAPT